MIMTRYIGKIDATSGGRKFEIYTAQALSESLIKVMVKDLAEALKASGWCVKSACWGVDNVGSVCIAGFEIYNG